MPFSDKSQKKLYGGAQPSSRPYPVGMAGNNIPGPTHFSQVLWSSRLRCFAGGHAFASVRVGKPGKTREQIAIHLTQEGNVSRHSAEPAWLMPRCVPDLHKVDQPCNDVIDFNGNPDSMSLKRRTSNRWTLLPLDFWWNCLDRSIRKYSSFSSDFLRFSILVELIREK